ncbi:MAG: c-type cytochrome [Pseudomonadota bacterium]|nr:c-type cytochrome [Pseudomonadota bacterium]
MIIMKKTLLAAALIGTTLASGAALSSNSAKPDVAAWTGATLDSAIKAMPKGDAKQGIVVAKQMMCNACHGEDGKPYTRNFPSIQGQNHEYTVKMMLDYRDGRRWENYKRADVMVKISADMTDQQIADVAAFYAEQPPTAWKAAAKEGHEQAKALATTGDMSRMVMACAGCHGAEGRGNGVTPALAGQIPEYFVRTMQAYHEKDRANDVNNMMFQFTKGLTEAEIKALADYYASLGPK